MATVFSERLWVGIALGIGFLLGVLNRIGKAREMVLYQLSQTATISDVIDKLSSPERQSRFGISAGNRATLQN
jgi:hypothetical protein